MAWLVDRLYALLLLFVLLAVFAAPAQAGPRAHAAMSRHDAEAEQYFNQAWDCHNYMAGKHFSPYICVYSGVSGPNCWLYKRNVWKVRQWTCNGQFEQMQIAPGPKYGVGRVCTVRTGYSQWKKRLWHRIYGCHNVGFPALARRPG